MGSIASASPTIPSVLPLLSLPWVWVRKSLRSMSIDRRMKGTDQQGSLGPDGVNRMIRDIRIAERWLGKEELYIDSSVASAKVKLERSIATNKTLHPGDIITEQDIHLLSPGDGFKWVERAKVVGHKVLKEIPRNEIIYPDVIR